MRRIVTIKMSAPSTRVGAAAAVLDEVTFNISNSVWRRFGELSSFGS
jgi:uncharacterized membrane protein